MNCRYCNSPHPAPMRFCDRCGGPGEAGSAPEKIAGWVEFQDAWQGFAVQHPPGWRVIQPCQGMVEILGPQGSMANFESGPLAPGLQSADLAARCASHLRAARPGLKIRQSPDGAILSFEDSQGQGQAQIHVGQGGFQIASCWSSALSAQSHLLGAMMSSMRAITPLPRSVWREPDEGCFAIIIPERWQARGGIGRDNWGHISQQWSCSPDASGLVALKGIYREDQFRQPAPKGLWGKFVHLANAVNEQMLDPSKMDSAPTLAYGSGAEVAERHYLSLWRQAAPDARIVGHREVPAGVDEQIKYLQPQLAMTLGGKAMASVSDVDVELTAQGMLLHKRYRIVTRRIDPAPTWIAALCFEAQAPAAEWVHWEPILVGIQESWRLQPSWVQRQVAEIQAATALYQSQAQADMSRRYSQISQTLSETSDIVAQGYWQRQPVAQSSGDWSYNWSQAMRGREDRSDDSGNRYDVPAGYDRYWVDTGGSRVIAGSWVVTPDPSWRELR